MYITPRELAALFVNLRASKCYLQKLLAAERRLAATADARRKRRLRSRGAAADKNLEFVQQQLRRLRSTYDELRSDAAEAGYRIARGWLDRYFERGSGDLAVPRSDVDDMLQLASAHLVKQVEKGKFNRRRARSAFAWATKVCANECVAHCRRYQSHVDKLLRLDEHLRDGKLYDELELPAEPDPRANPVDPSPAPQPASSVDVSIIVHGPRQAIRRGWPADVATCERTRIDLFVGYDRSSRDNSAAPNIARKLPAQPDKNNPSGRSSKPPHNTPAQNPVHW